MRLLYGWKVERCIDGKCIACGRVIINEDLYINDDGETTVCINCAE